uniref:Uncharacterized protein n=1 Tax=Pseudomonas phage PACT201 TaxID=3230130 RepID=A0AAU8GSS1_9VIRU
MAHLGHGHHHDAVSAMRMIFRSCLLDPRGKLFATILKESGISEDDGEPILRGAS